MTAPSSLLRHEGMKTDEQHFEEAVKLLQRLIAVPSFSNEEEGTADIWEEWLKEKGVKDVRRFHNNVYALSERFDEGKPVLLLNSHLDTVKPSASYTRDPFNPAIENGVLYGLGSNDAGGAGVSLATVFLTLCQREDLPFNMILAITASEERMGEKGMRAFLPHLKEDGLYPDMAIVGEPTSCEAAIAERGLVVCDVEVEGIAGHAARQTEGNAIYRAIDDINALRDVKWPAESETLGPIKVTVTMIDAGTQHNVIPDRCHYVADIRTTDILSNEETVEFLQHLTRWSRFTPRSTRIRASVLPVQNPLFRAVEALGLKTFVSPTTSDMALMHDIPSLKIGPGFSPRSHTADEFITLDELRQGMAVYRQLLLSLKRILEQDV